MTSSLHAQVTEQLRATNIVGGYTGALVCTHGGLLVASDGEGVSDEGLAGFTSLFDDIVIRAARDLQLGAVDEVTLLDRTRGRLVIRPINDAGDPRTFLVVVVPPKATWRRHTNRLVRQLQALLAPIITVDDDAADVGARERDA